MALTSFALAAALSTTMVGQDLKQKVELPFRIADNAIIVDVTVNGRPVSAMFDSGFSGAFVLGTHLDLGKSTGTMTLRDFVGSFEASTVDVNSLELGGAKVDSTGMTIVQQPTDHMSMSYGTHCDGIMGFEVLSKYVLEINFENKKFILHPKTHDITQLKPDNEKTFMASMLPIGNNSIELAVKTANGRTLALALDTGNAFYATTHRDVLERVGLWTEGKKPTYTKQSFVASGPVDSWYYKMNDVKIFGVPVKESYWDIIDRPSSSAIHDGTVGFGFLQNFNVTIDMSRRRVWLENFNGKVADDPVASAGFMALYDPSRQRMRIVNVTPNGPADKAGIKRGDDLLGVDGGEMRNMAYRQMIEIIEGEPGSTLNVSISRNGEFMRKELTRQVLVNTN